MSRGIKFILLIYIKTNMRGRNNGKFVDVERKAGNRGQ